MEIIIGIILIVANSCEFQFDINDFVIAQSSFPEFELIFMYLSILKNYEIQRFFFFLVTDSSQIYHQLLEFQCI